MGKANPTNRMRKADPTNTDARAIIYCRVSSDTRNRRSVEEQETECRQECERQGWLVGEVLTDNDRSASRFAKKARPAYERLRGVLRPGDILVTWEASRAQRDLKHFTELRDFSADNNVLWSYSGKLYDLNNVSDRLATGLDALLAEQEAEKTRERIMRAHRANLAAGKPHGRPVYGYRIVRDPDTGKSIGREPHPTQAPLVAEAAQRLLDGQSLHSLVRWMETQDPKGWDTAKLRRIVSNPAIAGYRTHKGQVHGEGTWDGLISGEQFADITALFAARKSGPRGVPVKHLLTGVAQCAECQEPLRRKLGGRDRKNGGRYQVLGCPNNHVARKMTAVDDAVADVIGAILSTPEVLESFALQSRNERPGVRARDELRELKERLAAVEEQLIAGKMPAGTGGRVATRLEEQIEEAIAAAATVYVSPVVGEVVNSPDPVAVWKRLPVADRRDFIRSTMRVTVGKVGKGRWHNPRDGINVEPLAR
jgi:site-specific DNA recombinase